MVSLLLTNSLDEAGKTIHKNSFTGYLSFSSQTI
jgi:hypothetical protein